MTGKGLGALVGWLVGRLVGFRFFIVSNGLPFGRVYDYLSTWLIGVRPPSIYIKGSRRVLHDCAGRAQGG